MAKTKNLRDYACVFPDMEYVPDVAPLPMQGVPRAMLSFVEGYAHWTLRPEGLSSLQELESSTGAMTQEYVQGYCKDEGLLQEIFHRIQIWGGEHGRYIYVQGPPFDWAEIGPAYRRLVLAAIDRSRTPGDLMRKAKGCNAAMQDQGRRLGMSFITKHVHFWSAVAFGADALPVYDRIMARGLRLRPVWEHLEMYWLGMQKKAAAEGISVTALERQMFIRFREEQGGADE